MTQLSTEPEACQGVDTLDSRRERPGPPTRVRWTSRQASASPLPDRPPGHQSDSRPHVKDSLTPGRRSWSPQYRWARKRPPGAVDPKPEPAQAGCNARRSPTSRPGRLDPGSAAPPDDRPQTGCVRMKAGISHAEPTPTPFRPTRRTQVGRPFAPCKEQPSRVQASFTLATQATGLRASSTLRTPPTFDSQVIQRLGQSRTGIPFPGTTPWTSSEVRLTYLRTHPRAALRPVRK